MQTPLSDLEYADDILLGSTRASPLQKLIDATHTYCEQHGMQLSNGKNLDCSLQGHLCSCNQGRGRNCPHASMALCTATH